MSDRETKKRGARAGAAAGFALGAAITSVLLILTSTSILLFLLVPPLLLAYLGSMFGERVGLFSARQGLVIAVSVVVLLLGAILPERIQAYRYQRIIDTALPTYPGAELKEYDSDRISGRRTPGFVLVYGTEDPPDAIVGYVRREMVNLGWTELEALYTDRGTMYRYQKPGMVAQFFTDYSNFEFTITCAMFNLYHRYVPPSLDTAELDPLHQ